jgi:hypothetical protein
VIVGLFPSSIPRPQSNFRPPPPILRRHSPVFCLLQVSKCTIQVQINCPKVQIGCLEVQINYPKVQIGCLEVQINRMEVQINRMEVQINYLEV